ncbi:MAG TPA: hypothetical protein VFP69_10805, partial [Streptomyces sp.]|nr:hypothetical protein [Streptomyces sp.]
MPTDYACQTAAERAAHCLTPVCAVLAPEQHRTGQEAEVLPVVLRNYLGAGPVTPAVPRVSTPTVRTTTGAAVLRLCLDGLRAEMDGSLAQWHAGLTGRFPALLRNAQASRADWTLLQELQFAAQDMVTHLARRAPHGSPGVRALGTQVALLEDVLSGVLRRLAVPAEHAAA